MNKHKNAIKTAAALLALLMITALVPFGALRSDAVPRLKITASGKCGDNVNWRLYEDGSMVIDGIGEMYDYDQYSPAPWYERYRKSIIKLSVEGDVSSIGDYAFYACTRIASVTVSDKVKKIGELAFGDIASLAAENISLPDKPLYIKGDAFSGTKSSDEFERGKSGDGFYIGKHFIRGAFSLTGSFTVKEGTLSIAEIAFFGAYSVESITLPQSVKIIGRSAFYGCMSLVSLNIPGGVTEITESMCSHCYKLADIIIPAGVKRIGAEAFEECRELKSVNIPEGVTYVGKEAFMGCKEIRTFVLQEPLAEIGDKAFGYYYDAGTLTKVLRFLIYCHKGSAAEKYAQANGFSVRYINRTYIPDFPAGSTLEDFNKKYPIGNLIIIDRKGERVTSGKLGTGFKVMQGSIGSYEYYEIVVKGDTDGNGVIDTTDLITIKRHFLNISRLYTSFSLAADVDGNDNIDSTDYLRVRSYMLGLSKI